MKKLFSLLLVSMLLVTGCGKEEKENKKEPIKGSSEEVVEDNKMSQSEAILEAKTIAKLSIVISILAFVASVFSIILDL